MRIRYAKIIMAILLIANIWVVQAIADSVPPEINMNDYSEQYKPGVIKATVYDNEDVSSVTLFYRKPGETSYNSIQMKKDQDIYYRDLNREFGVSGVVEYYLLAQDTSGNQQTEPVIQPEISPMTAAMDGAVNQSAPEVYLTSPEAGTELNTGEETIMISFFSTEREVDFNTIRIKIDRRDRTREAELVGNVLIWEPRRPLSDGYHEIEVIVKDTDGEYLGPNVWTFNVKTKRQLPLGTEGDFYMGLQYDDRSGSDTGVPLWNNKIDLGLKGQKGWLNWSAGAMVSSEESSFLTSENIGKVQPINRYYFDGRTKHFQFRLGDSNPNFSDLSLKGVLIRGANLEFKSNRFNAQFVTGYNKRDIDQQMTIIYKHVTRTSATTYVDEDLESHTLTNYQEMISDGAGKYNVYEFDPGTFKRDVIALKLDTTPIKNKKATWKIGLNFFGAEDDSSSLKYDTYYTEGDSLAVRGYAYADSMFETGYTPSKNWVGTIQTSVRFNNNRSELSAEFGGTIVTENLFGNITEDMKDELPSGINDDVFRLNSSTQTSFNKNKLSSAPTSVYLFKLNTPVPVPKTKTTFNAELYRFPTHYVSFGNPQQKTDIGGMKFNIRSRVLKDQVTFNFGLDTYSDNLDGDRKQYTGSGSQKDLTKDTNVATYGVTYRPKILPQYAPNIGLGFRTYHSENDLDIKVTANDTTSMIDTSTNTLMLNLGGTLPIGLQKHEATLSFTNMSISDNRSLLDYQDYMRNESENFTIILNVNSSLNFIPLTINTSIGNTSNVTYRQDVTKRKEIDTGIMMFSLSGTYKWLRDKRLSTTAGFSYLGSSNDESLAGYEIDNTRTSFRAEVNYKVTSVASVGALFRYINYSDNVSSANDYTEPIFGMTLRSAF